MTNITRLVWIVGIALSVPATTRNAGAQFPRPAPDVPENRLEFDLGDPANWRWTLAVPVPSAVRLVQRPAQRVAWLVHHGPYEDEGPTLGALYAFVVAQGLTPAGPHTETYLNDPSRTAPADLRTEIRVPVA